MTIDIVWSMGKPINYYGVLGAIGVAVLDRRYKFMPEDYDDVNRPRLWATYFLSRGMIRLALDELKLKHNYNVLKMTMPDIDTDYEGYIDKLERMQKQLKEQGL